jgi:hypothetical protein
MAIKLLMASGMIGMGVIATSLLYGQRKNYLASIRKWKRNFLLESINKTDDKRFFHDDDLCGYIQEMGITEG